MCKRGRLSGTVTGPAPPSAAGRPRRCRKHRAGRLVAYLGRSRQTITARPAASAATTALSHSGTGAPFKVICQPAMNRKSCRSAIEP